MSNAQGRLKMWLLTATVPANTQDFVIEKTLGENVQFVSEELGGLFETLHNDGSDIVDTGVCPFRISLQDAGRNYLFTDNYTPADLLLSAGRRKSVKATNNSTAPAGGNVYQYIKFNHTFTNKIECKVANDSNVDQQIWVMFKGREILKIS